MEVKTQWWYFEMSLLDILQVWPPSPYDLPSTSVTRISIQSTTVTIIMQTVSNLWTQNIDRETRHCSSLDSALLSGSSSRFATTSMKYKWPAIVLEEIEEDIEQFQCSKSAITVQFKDQLSLEYGREAWADLSEFLLVSSHPGCNEDGERAPYL